MDFLLQGADPEPLLPLQGGQKNRTSHSSSEMYIQEDMTYPSKDGVDGLQIEGINDKVSVNSNDVPDRVYYVDWMRVCQIYMVVCYHVVQALDEYVGLFEGDGRIDPTLEDQPIGVNPTGSRVLVENFQTYCLMVGMPMFFYVSGRAQALGKQSKHFSAVVASRTMRLFVPFLAAYAMLIPIWMYMHWPLAPEEAQKSLWNFELWYWSPKGFSFQPAWLWFLPALFFVDVGAAPLLRFSETKGTFEAFLSVVMITLNTAYFRNSGLSWAYCIWSHVGACFPILMTFVIPFPDKQGQEVDGKLMTWTLSLLKWQCFQKSEQLFKETKNEWQQVFQWVAVRLSTAVQILATIAMVSSFEYDSVKSMGAPACNLFFLFYMHGYFFERWQGSKDLFPIVPSTVIHGPEEWQKHRSLECFKKFVRVYQIVVTFSVGMIAIASAPAGRRERMLYPAFSASFEFEPGVRNIGFAVCHILGTWAWIAIWPGLFQAYLDHLVQPGMYKHASASTTVVYIFHWMFLKWFCVFVLDKYALKGSFFWKLVDIPALFCFAVGGSLMIYWALLRSPKWLPIGKLFGL